MTRKNLNKHLFAFKEFSLSDNKCAMKIGTDGVLLGGFAANFFAGRVLDIGTGCGLIALMIAQKNRALIHAVEIDKEAADQARENFSNSLWQNRLKVFHVALQEFVPPNNARYDLIVSNPPFFRNSLKNPDYSRSLARHNDLLSYSDLFVYSSPLLSPAGRIIIIVPYDQEEEVCRIAATQNIFLQNKLIIKPSLTKPPKRVILEFTFQKNNSPNQKNFIIESGERHQFTDDYIGLLKDYHPFL
jgi:tRNA1Val (adenine37-N6)-methyltransferase